MRLNKGFLLLQRGKFIMARKWLTQVFPWLLPIRRKQRALLFYTQMRFDKNRYATKLWAFHASASVVYLKWSHAKHIDMIYQENKVHNLKLAVSPYAADDHRTPRSQNKGFPWATQRRTYGRRRDDDRGVTWFQSHQPYGLQSAALPDLQWR